MTQETLNNAIQDIDFSENVLSAKHGFMAILDGKPFITSDNKILFRNKSTLQSHLCWLLKGKVYDIMLHNNEVPLAVPNNYGVEYNGRRYIGKWSMYDRMEFKTRYKQVYSALKNSGRLVIQYI